MGSGRLVGVGLLIAVCWQPRPDRWTWAAPVEQAAGPARAVSATARAAITPLPDPSDPATSAPPGTAGAPGGLATPASGPGEPVEMARILAWVGDQPILVGDLMGFVNKTLEKRLGELPERVRQQITPEQLDRHRWALLEQLLPNAIDTKLAYLDFRRKIPAERLPEAMSQVYKQYDEHELPKLMEAAGAATLAELETQLRRVGSSIDKERRMYAEQMLAREMIRQNVDFDQEVTHEELLSYYQEHLDQYSYPDRVRWEQLSTLFGFYPDRWAARAALVEMGNRVVNGAPFDVVARESSQGLTAANGGRYDWTTRGTLVSKVLEEAIFTLPVGQLSEILEDEAGWHIVRVIERQKAGRIPFAEVQQEIREAIRKERIQPQIDAYLGRLRRETPVWTLFDAQADRP